jgi:hypothetical protein
MSQNFCVVCKLDLGPENPRQLCCKSYCPYEISYESTPSHSSCRQSQTVEQEQEQDQTQSKTQSTSTNSTPTQSCTMHIDELEQKSEFKKSDIRSFFKPQ